MATGDRRAGVRRASAVSVRPRSRCEGAAAEQGAGADRAALPVGAGDAPTGRRGAADRGAAPAWAQVRFDDGYLRAAVDARGCGGVKKSALKFQSRPGALQPRLGTATKSRLETGNPWGHRAILRPARRAESPPKPAWLGVRGSSFRGAIRGSGITNPLFFCWKDGSGGWTRTHRGAFEGAFLPGFLRATGSLLSTAEHLSGDSGGGHG